MEQARIAALGIAGLHTVYSAGAAAAITITKSHDNVSDEREHMNEQRGSVAVALRRCSNHGDVARTSQRALSIRRNDRPTTDLV